MAWMTPIIAASAKQQQNEEEERKMLQELQRDDAEGRYEFKFLRSHMQSFASSTKQQEVLQQEARAGWELVAKLDNARLLVRRERSMREADALLSGDADPYRIYVDNNFPVIAGLVILVVLGLVFLGIFMSPIVTLSFAPIILIIVVIAVLLAVFVAVAVRVAR